MKIGVLYICTGNYSIFWKTFYQSAQQYFLTDCEKHFFVFTDDLKIKGTDFIHVKHESSKGFPLDSLLRFDMFLSIKKDLIEMDYIFFFNSNMQFVKSIGKEILPINIDSGLVGVFHPGYYSNKKINQYPYERNVRSKAFIKFKRNLTYHYYMGILNGGKTSDYIKLSEICSENIYKDMENGLMAIYHDESHLNKYFHGKEVLNLSPAYGYPEGSNIPIEPKILILNKMKHGGSYFDKLPEKAYGLRIYLKLKRLFYAFIWKYQ
jgi:hypothetical protein